MGNKKPTYHFADLALTKLHYVKCGCGEPLIIVPATISEIENWLGLIQFMAQKFTVYFFELPGHGKSKKFPKEFSSDLLAQTVEDFIDFLGHKKVNLMGFSFGGILTVKILNRIRDRVKKIALLSPCLGSEMLAHSKRQISVIKLAARIAKKEKIQNRLIKYLHDEKKSEYICKFLGVVGRVENLDQFKKKLNCLPASTLDVLVYQIHEILATDFTKIKPFSTPLFFGMSTNDPLLSYKKTELLLKKLFPKISITKWDFQFHQPPEPLAFDVLNRDYKDLLKKFSNT